MRLLLLLLCCVIPGLIQAEAAPPRTQLVDRAIRYVNEEVITLRDLIDRAQNQRNRQIPKTPEEELVMLREQLEELTIDGLLVQFADSKGVLVDGDRINQMVLDEARRTGRGLNLVDMARARKRFEQREKISAALGFFDLRSATVSPQELLAAYAARKDTFVRPARAHVFQLVLRPTDPAERQTLSDDQSRVFRQAQDADPQAAAVVAPLLEKLVALDPEAPERATLLDEAMTALAALPLEVNAAPALRTVVETAGKLVERRAAMRTPAEVEARLKALRQELDGQGEAAFRAAAQKLSQGARAEDGGDLGWLEPGVFAKDLDAAVFALQAGELSQPLWSEQVCCLMFMAERTQATQRSFAEVVGELESQLRQERQAGIRKRAAEMLRRRAVVRDLAPLEELLRGG